MVNGLGGKVPDGCRSHLVHAVDEEGRPKLQGALTRRRLQKLHLRCRLLWIVLADHTTPKVSSNDVVFEDRLMRLFATTCYAVDEAGPLATKVSYIGSTWAVVV